LIPDKLACGRGDAQIRLPHAVHLNFRPASIAAGISTLPRCPQEQRRILVIISALAASRRAFALFTRPGAPLASSVPCRRARLRDAAPVQFMREAITPPRWSR